MNCFGIGLLCNESTLIYDTVRVTAYSGMALLLHVLRIHAVTDLIHHFLAVTVESIPQLRVFI